MSHGLGSSDSNKEQQTIQELFCGPCMVHGDGIIISSVQWLGEGDAAQAGFREGN